MCSTMLFMNRNCIKKHLASLIAAVLVLNLLIVLIIGWSTTGNSNTSIKTNNGYNNGNQLQFPSLAQYLPHITDEKSAITPSHKLSKRQPNKKASIVFGIPHVCRSKGSYLMKTLHSLIRNSTIEEIVDILFVVFIGETDIDYVMNVTKTIENAFKQFIDFGVIEVISPSQQYYPDFNKTFTKQTLGDPLKRVHWRTKENLDKAYLMTYCYTKGEYFFLLEDDVIAKPGYLLKIRRIIIELNLENDWFVISFCRTGTVSMLFKCSSLPQLIGFLLMFASEQPCDLLIEYFVRMKSCMDCAQENDSLVRKYFDLLLFHHIGVHSSLDGKVQRRRC